MSDFLKDYKGVSWTSPSGRLYNLKTLINEYTRQHIGEVKSNPKVDSSTSKKRVQDSNDTFTDLGLGGRDISLDCLFIGDNHYAKAEEFAKALGEVGKSILQLAHGEAMTVNVLSFKVSNDLTKNVNSTVVSVEFHETSKTTYPRSTQSRVKEIKNKADVAKTNVAQTLANATEAIKNPSRLAKFSANFSAMLAKVEDGLNTASNVSLNSIMKDILSQTPLNNMFTVASQLGIVMYKAASLANNAKNSITNSSILPSGGIYGQWVSLLDGFKKSSTSIRETITQEEIDNLLINDSSATLALISMGESLIEGEYETRAEAVEAAKTIKELEQSWTEYIEKELSKITTLEEFLIRDNSLSDIIDTVAAEILERSCELKVEQIITLSEDSTVLDLALEYYEEDFNKNPDETLDYFIRTNNLSDDDFFLLKRGTDVKIYV